MTVIWAKHEPYEDGRLAVTTAEQIFSVAWNPVKERLRLICGSLELSDGPLRAAADLYLSRIVRFTPASRLPAALHQSALCANSGPSIICTWTRQSLDRRQRDRNGSGGPL